jgi:SET domain
MRTSYSEGILSSARSLPCVLVWAPLRALQCDDVTMSIRLCADKNVQHGQAPQRRAASIYEMIAFFLASPHTLHVSLHRVKRCSVFARSMRESAAQESSLKLATLLPTKTERLLRHDMATESALRESLARRRAFRRSGLAVSAATLTASAIAALSSGILAVPVPPTVALSAFASVLIAVAALAEAEIGLDGVVYLRRRRPPLRMGLDTRATIVVRETDDGRGRGAFAAVCIPANTSLGDYQGELLDTAAFLSRYPPGALAEYAIAVDSLHVLDGRAAVAGARNFTPALMNHSRRRERVNVARLHSRRDRRVSFYTSRAVEAGEELMFDYGRRYWRGREDMEMA